MYHFSRFQSLLNENPKNSLGELRRLGDRECIVTEKLHGANLAVYIPHEGQIRLASRNQILPVDTNFLQCHRFFTEEVLARLEELRPQSEGITVRVTGELFGGHDALGVKPVQREIHYDGDIQWRIFHVDYLDGENVSTCSWDFIETVSKILGIPTVPVIAKGPLAEMYAMDVEVPSTLSSKGDVQEGFCFRVGLDDENEPAIIFKRRSTNFCETKGKVGDKHLAENAMDPEVLTIFNEAVKYATAQRVSNVNSHHGFSVMQDFAKLHAAVMDDIKTDLQKETGISDDVFKIVRKDIGKVVVGLVKDELTK